MRPWALRGLIAFAGMALLAGVGGLAVMAEAKPRTRAPGAVAFTATATPVAEFRPEFAAGVEFRGGVSLTADNPDFGGISGMALDADGVNLVAVSDAGFWVTGRVTEADGRPAGLADARIGPVLGPDGRPAALTDDGDTESLTMEAGTAWLGVEGANVIDRFDFRAFCDQAEIPDPTKTRLFKQEERDFPINMIGNRHSFLLFDEFDQKAKKRHFKQEERDFPISMIGNRCSRDNMLARAERVATPPGVKDLPYNRGLEALAKAPDGSALGGALVAISERSGKADQPTRGFIIGGPLQGEFLVQRTPPFDITDAAFLPGGDLLVLERRFSVLGWFGMRLRRIPGDQIRPGSRLEGTVLLEASRSSPVDNMEALAVSRNARGETIITLMSDNNYSFLQRTLLLRFALIAP